MCKSYQDVRGFKNRLNGYLKQLNKGATTIVVDGENKNVLGKVLNLTLPDVLISNEHLDVLKKFIEDSKNDYGIDVIITIVK